MPNATNDGLFAAQTGAPDPAGSADSFTPSRLDNIRALRACHQSSYFCPICATVSARFLDGGVARRRRNARCPGCGSLERHRLFWLHFVNEVWPCLPARKKDVLHIAPEPFFANLLKPHAEVNYLSGDLMMPEAMLKVDLTDMQFHDNQLDVIICSHVLEHIPDDRKAMTEMHRVLRPGGFLLVMVPTYGNDTYENWDVSTPEERLHHFGQADHVRKYGRDIMLRLEQAGFIVTEWTTASFLAPDIAAFISSGKRALITGQKQD